MADMQIIGADRLDLCDEIDSAKALAGALWLAVQAVEIDHRGPLAELACVVEDRLAGLSRRCREAAGAADSN